jgi:hypothetical protein
MTIRAFRDAHKEHLIVVDVEYEYDYKAEREWLGYRPGDEGEKEEEDKVAEWFNRKYPEAVCYRCRVKVTVPSVKYCGEDTCKTWYCRDCYYEGTHDCDLRY